MLTDLSINNLAVVEAAEIEFDAGLTTLTGETGAGKSILIHSLLLVLGERASADAVRSGAKRAEVSALFDLADSPAALEWLREQELDDGDECQLRRTLSAEGRSRSYINSQPVPTARVRELGALLMDIHGQHEYQQLMKSDSQAALLDGFAGNDELLGQLADGYSRWHQIDQRYQQLEAQQTDQSQAIELITFQLNELQSLLEDADTGSWPEQWQQIQQEHQRAKHARGLIEGCQQLLQLLDEGEVNATTLLSAASNQFSQLCEIDADLEPIARLVDEADIQLREALHSLSRYSDRLDLDPQRLSWLEERISSAISLARKHQCEAVQLAERSDSLQAELTAIEHSDEALTDLARQRSEALADYLQLAQQLSGARQTAALTLADQVNQLLQKLGMADASLQIDLAARDDRTPHPAGLEKVNYLFSANPGMRPGPLARIASGGELSRISLALQVAAKGQSSVATLVFDEVDVGVGGAVAEIVGQLLRQLGTQRQVICITHLPQVAAQGHRQTKISKSTDGQSSSTRVEPLDENARIEEIARMLAGIELTDESIAHAEQMLNHSNSPDSIAG